MSLIWQRCHNTICILKHTRIDKKNIYYNCVANDNDGGITATITTTTTTQYLNDTFYKL